MAVTIKDIAKMAGVSPTTVSNVINDRSAKAKEETKQRIMKLVEEYNYQPNAIARGLVKGRSKMIGVMLSDITNPYFSQLIDGIEEVASKSGYSILVCNTHNDANKEEKYIDIMKQYCVEGIIFTSCAIKKSEHLQALVNAHYPMVTIDKRIDGFEEVFNVSVDNYISGYLATKYLIDLGHKNIGCITGQLWASNAVDRLNGYKKAMEDYNLPIDESYIYSSKFDMKTGIDGANYFFENNKEITGIVACGDIIGYGIYKAANDANISIPKDLSVIGIDDIFFSDVITPGLTTLKQPIDELAVQATDTLLSLIEGKKVENKSYSYEAKLIVRSSTKELG